MKNAVLDGAPSFGDRLFQTSRVVLRGDGLQNLNDRFLGFGHGDESRDNACRSEFAQQRHQSVSIQDELGQIGSPNSETIKNAYTVYSDAPIGKMVLKPLHDPDCAGNRYLPHMTADEEGAWDPLVGLYVPRIALILEPSALTSGTISKDALERAGTIASYFFPNAVMAMKLVHEDKHELRRVKALRFIAEHPGCCRRDILRKLTCSVMEFEKDIKPTLIARGEISVNEDRHFPLAA